MASDLARPPRSLVATSNGALHGAGRTTSISSQQKAHAPRPHSRRDLSRVSFAKPAEFNENSRL